MAEAQPITDTFCEETNEKKNSSRISKKYDSIEQFLGTTKRN